MNNLDPNIIDMDPEKPLNQQQSEPRKETKNPEKANTGPKVERKRVYWNPIDESKLKEGNVWDQIKGGPESSLVVGVEIEREEFDSSFTKKLMNLLRQKRRNSQ
jgi:hypothetical protein